MTQCLKFLRRKIRNRIALKKNSARPRLSVFRSNKHIYAQIVDLETSNVLACASSLDIDLKKDKNINSNFGNKHFAALVGELIAKRAYEKNVVDIVFDKSGYKYHGVVAVLADEARKILNF